MAGADKNCRRGVCKVCSVASIKTFLEEYRMRIPIEKDRRREHRDEGVQFGEVRFWA